MLHSIVQQNGKCLLGCHILCENVLRLKKQLSTDFVLCEVQTGPKELIEPQACYTTQCNKMAALRGMKLMLGLQQEQKRNG